MENSNYRTLSRMLRIGKQLLVLLEITILTNKQGENNTSWFTDNELMDVLVMLREPIYQRMDELVKQGARTKKKPTKTNIDDKTRLKTCHVFTGKKVKVGLQLTRHSVSNICLMPNQSGGHSAYGSARHSGGFDDMILFPEKVQVVVCENIPVSKESPLCHGIEFNEVNPQPTSRYFKSTNSSNSRTTTTQSNKKKKITLKRIVSQTSQPSTSDGGGFAVNDSPASPVHTVSQHEEQRENFHEDIALEDHEGSQSMNMDIQQECVDIHLKENRARIEKQVDNWEKNKDVLIEHDNWDAERNNINVPERVYTTREHENNNIPREDEKKCTQSNRQFSTSVLSFDKSENCSQLDDLPEVSFAKEVETEIVDFSMATTSEELTDGGKKVLNCHHKSLLIEETVNEHSTDGKYHSADSDDGFSQLAIKKRPKVTIATENDYPLTSDGNTSQNNSHSCTKSTDKTNDMQMFFQTCNYENVKSQNESCFLKLSNGHTSKKNRRKKQQKPLQVSSLQNSNTSASLKRFDVTASRKPRKKYSSGGLSESRRPVTAENWDSLWTIRRKKEARVEVIDLVSREEQMTESLKPIKNISELSEDQLQYLTQQNESYLRDIFQGKRACLRHTEYKSSSTFRAGMTYLVSYGYFSQDNMDIIMDTLVPIFCKKGSKYLDYVSKVLLPELLVKICMDVLHLDYDEAQRLF